MVLFYFIEIKYIIRHYINSLHQLCGKLFSSQFFTQIQNIRIVVLLSIAIAMDYRILFVYSGWSLDIYFERIMFHGNDIYLPQGKY